MSPASARHSGCPLIPQRARTALGRNQLHNGNVRAARLHSGFHTHSTDEEGEALLDVEWAGAVAPNAIVDFVACETGSGVGSYGTDISATAIANYLYSTVSSTSLSYGVCETSAGTTA